MDEKKDCYRARKAYQRARTRTTEARERVKYREARRMYIQAIVQAKRSSWEQFVREEGTRDDWKVVRSVRRFEELPRQIATATVQMVSHTWEKVADKWLDHFIKKDDIGEDTEWQKKWREASKTPPDDIETVRVEPKEVMALIRRL